MLTPRGLFLAVMILAVVLVAFPNASIAQDDAPLLPLTDPMAPFLESRAVAVEKGATAEFRKMEWVAIDPVNNKLYVAMTEINQTMSDGEGAIQLEENNCGIVYEADLDENYNTSSLKPLIVGGPYDENAENRCDVDNIANPDSVFVDPQGNLWIGEDSSNHVNNALWRWDGKELKRFATVPKGAEVTGTFITDNGDLFVNAQHPSAMNPHPFNRGFIGAVSGFNTKDDFTALPVPEGADMHKMKVAKGRYNLLARAGELIPNDIYGDRIGQVNDINGDMLEMCNHPDGNVFIATTDDNTEGYLFTNYECQPGAVSRLYVRKSGTGWKAVEGENIDFSGVNGTWNNCGASKTPWNTALTAEEYEPIATTVGWDKNVAPMTDYMGEQANPYDYGYLVELKPDTDGDSVGTVVEKRYAMGRFSHEMGAIAPDEKTVYNGDDGSGVVMFKFVADEAGDLSAGTLYAAKVTQQDDNSLALEWIELGKGNDDEIAEAVSAIELPSQ